MLNRGALLSIAVLLCLPGIGHSEQANRLREILPRFEQYAGKAMAQWEIPGMAVAIVKGDTLVYERGWGVRESGQKQPVDGETLFQIGSITKSFTALLLGMEADSGKLDFSDRVIDHFPSFQTSDEWVTSQFMIEDLLAQRSGLPTTGADLQVMFGNTRHQVIANIRHVRPVTSFRSRFAYQNNFFLVAAKVAEKLSGRPFEEDVAERLFSPLGMNRSVATVSEYLASINASAQHQRIGGRIEVLPGDWPYQFAAETFAPAASISSSVREMAAYMSLHMNSGLYKGKRLVSEKTMRHLHSPKIALDHGALGGRTFYCQGLMLDWYHGRTLIWHNGGTSGGKNIMMFDPEAKVGIVILSNLQGTLLPEFLALSFFDLYFDLPFKDKNGRAAEALNKANHDTYPPPRPETTAPARPLASYVGNYSNQVAGPVHVFHEQGKLQVTLGNVAMAHELRHHDGDTFWLSLPLVDVDASGFGRFEFDSQGQVRKLILDSFVDNGIGPFVLTGKSEKLVKEK